MFGIMIQVQPCVSKYGNSALWPCHFGKYLLTVGGDEQQENAISPSILNVFVVHFLEHIPYMYVHLPTMLECEKCQWVLSECNMSCSLLSTVMSNKWQYLHECWLCISVALFWNIPIIDIGRYLQCQNANVMYQSCQKWNWCAHCLPQSAAISLWNVPFFLTCQHGVCCSVQCSDLNHQTANYMLISWAIYFQTFWMTLCYHKKSDYRKVYW